MRAVDLIRTKRDGGTLSSEEIRWLIKGYTEGQVGDDQMAAFAMAVFFQGMESAELAALVQSMMGSGETIDLSRISGRKVDKHSTGGVGDKVSLCLAPLVAACGVPVPMISGRGLGHTGGTLDKLCAIPGFSVDVPPSRFVELVEQHGLALIGQTETLVPADRKLYALRDVTSTVESIPLISASIMSKKLAEGIDGLVLDVKVGSGAFMKTEAQATELAKTMIGIGERMNRRVIAVISDMNQVLGRAVGNANETWEAIEVLKGGGPADLVELTLELGAQMLLIGQVAKTKAEATRALQAAIDDGRGLERFRALISAQGGDPRALDDRAVLPQAKHETEVCAEAAGTLSAMNTEAVGRAAMLLGAGRAKSSDVIDPAVGLEMLVRLGDRVEKGQPLVKIAYNESAQLEAAKAALLAAISWDAPDAQVAIPPLVHARLGERVEE